MAPRPSGQGEQAFQEGRGPRFWLLLGWQEEEEEKRASGRWSAGPHLNHPKELLEFPPLCEKTGRRVLGATDLLPQARAWPPHPPGPGASGVSAGAGEPGAQGMAWPFISCAASGKSHGSPEPQWSHWQRGDDSSSLLWLL